MGYNASTESMGRRAGFHVEWLSDGIVAGSLKFGASIQLMDLVYAPLKCKNKIECIL